MLEQSEVSDLRGQLERTEATQGGARGDPASKSFLLFPWLWDIARSDPSPVEQLIGPDILLWNTIF